MSFYSVNFSGGTWSNDSGESPYYCGVYSSLDQAQHFTRLAMIDELVSCDCDCDPDNGHELNLQDMKFPELEAYYEDRMDCAYEIDTITCTTPDFQYKVEDPVKSYRNYYRADKAYIAFWKNRNIPEWWSL